jgi:UDP-glucose 4-epimerase
MKKIVILGGSGFIGSHLADYLSQKNFKVTIFDLKKSKWKKNNQRLIVGDLLDIKKLDQAIKGSDIVYNFAAVANMDLLKDRAISTVKYNILGTVNALEVSRKYKIKKFIHASTIYANTEEGGFYGRSKKAAEDYVEEYKKMFNLNYTILRFGSMYGDRSGNDNGMRQILKNLLLKKRLIYKGTANSVRRYLYVKDAVKLCYQSMQKKFDNKYLILTGQKKIKAEFLFKMLAKLFKVQKKNIKYLKNKGHYDIKPTPFKPRPGEYLLHNSSDFKKNIIEYVKKLKISKL